MESENGSSDFSGVVDSIMHLFGEVMSRDAVYAVVEHYNGDLNQSIDAIVKMHDENAPAGYQSDEPTQPKEINDVGTISRDMTQNFNTCSSVKMSNTPMSYAGVSQDKGVCNKLFRQPTVTNTRDSKIWTPQTNKIAEYHSQGSRILILMRGLPGSGKSYLAKELLQSMCPDAVCKSHILSTDDFFMNRKEYDFDKRRLPEAHIWNQNRARGAMYRGLSPIFIDNTNIEIWEMEPYVKDGLNNGYFIEVVEPRTPWAKKANELAKKNIHNVPIFAIKRKLENYQNDITGTYLIRSCGLSYSPDKKPPVRRNFPAIIDTANIPPLNQATYSNRADILLPNSSLTQEKTKTAFVQDQRESEVYYHIATSNNLGNAMLLSEDKNKSCIGRETTKNTDDVVKITTNQELIKQLEEIEKLDQEWENGESWNENTDPCIHTEEKPSVTPLRRRGSVETESFLSSSINCDDWTKISMFMPAWKDYQHKNQEVPSSIKVETATHGTCVEYGDTDMKNKNLKVLIGTPKDINFYHMGSSEEKIPEKRMLDKSSMTYDHDRISTKTVRCKYEEKHFAKLRNFFKNIPKVELRDIFDKCLGDVNWAVSIVMDGMANNQFRLIDSDDFSDTEEIDDDLCECLAAYNIIPDINAQPVKNAENSNKIVIDIPNTPKIKKDKTVLQSSIELKRTIEHSVVISDSHYSEHCLRIRKIRRGEINDDRGDSIQEEVEYSSNKSTPTTTPIVTESTLSMDTDDVDSQSSNDDCERTVNVDLGTVFVSELDEVFGRSEMDYPDHITTRVNMPISLLNEINALWVESLTHQIDQQSRQSKLMLRQDQEFARQLALKEEQLAEAGLEPAVPDLKEIMDMELALSIYNKEITAGWRDQEPNDWAARMTRDKLYNLFPDVDPDILSELLMAHDNNFKATVEVLLSSTGNAQILVEQNGITKFIAKKELERHKKTLEEQKKALSEVEWPLLPKDVKVDMSTVKTYRAKASEYLAQRNMYYEKAKEFFGRNMMDVASYYSEVSVMHKNQFEQANSMAAATLIQVTANQAKDNSTIDLHYLSVPEAIELLDGFIDVNIKKLRNAPMGAPRHHTLFFITGRGLHSPGCTPRIKPAVKRRLRERAIAFAERNPGLLSSKVCPEDRMTTELP